MTSNDILHVYTPHILTHRPTTTACFSIAGQSAAFCWDLLKRYQQNNGNKAPKEYFLPAAPLPLQGSLFRQGSRALAGSRDSALAPTHTGLMQTC